MEILNNKIVKATYTNLLVALIFICIIYFSVKILAGEQLTRAISLINIVTVSENNKQPTEKVTLNLEKNSLELYPSYGDKYGEVTIDSLDVKLPLYFGSSLDILRKGVGHSTGSYFPGEGGSIVCMAHDTAGFLKYLYTIKTGEKINIKTDYGKFTYQIYDTKIVDQKETSAINVQKDEEILMLYTCYPSNSIGHATHRFITYSKLVEKEIY